MAQSLIGRQRKPVRNVQNRPAGSCWYDDHNRGLYLLLGYQKNLSRIPDVKIKSNIAKIEKVMGKKFGDLKTLIFCAVWSS